MHLSAYGTKITSSYSGGNKRKLSTAIALVGDPMVVLLVGHSSIWCGVAVIIRNINVSTRTNIKISCVVYIYILHEYFAVILHR